MLGAAPERSPMALSERVAATECESRLPSDGSRDVGVECEDECGNHRGGEGVAVEA
jgi:hypothetical protein